LSSEKWSVPRFIEKIPFFQQRISGEQAVPRRRPIEKRFGAIPAGVEERLVALSPAELEDLSVRVLEVGMIEELFR
jgi:Domain of unknown function (DUF4351)